MILILYALDKLLHFPVCVIKLYHAIILQNTDSLLQAINVSPTLFTSHTEHITHHKNYTRADIIGLVEHSFKPAVIVDHLLMETSFTTKRMTSLMCVLFVFYREIAFFNIYWVVSFFVFVYAY